MSGFPDRGGNAGGSGESILGRELSNLFETYGPYRLPSLKRPCMKVCGAAIPRGILEGAKVNLMGRVSDRAALISGKNHSAALLQLTSFSLTGADNEGSSFSSLSLVSEPFIKGGTRDDCL